MRATGHPHRTAGNVQQSRNHSRDQHQLGIWRCAGAGSRCVTGIELGRARSAAHIRLVLYLGGAPRSTARPCTRTA